MVVAEKDVLDAGPGEPSDHLQQRRSAGRQVKFGGRSVEGDLALAAFGRDHGQVPRRRVHVLKQRHAIAQTSAVGRAGPCHCHENMRVRSARASRFGLAATVAGKDGNVVADIGEQGRGHDRQRHGVDCPRCCLGDTDPGCLFVVAPKGVDFGIDRAAVDHDARRARFRRCARPAGQTAMAATITPARTSHARAVMKESQAAR